MPMWSSDVDVSSQGLVQLMMIAELCPGGMCREEDLLEEIPTKTVTDKDDGLTGTVARRTFMNQIGDQTCHSSAA